MPTPNEMRLNAAYDEIATLAANGLATCKTLQPILNHVFRVCEENDAAGDVDVDVSFFKDLLPRVNALSTAKPTQAFLDAKHDQFNPDYVQEVAFMDAESVLYADDGVIMNGLTLMDWSEFDPDPEDVALMKDIEEAERMVD